MAKRFLGMHRDNYLEIMLGLRKKSKFEHDYTMGYPAIKIIWIDCKSFVQRLQGER
jgi:hypothetical protein